MTWTILLYSLGTATDRLRHRVLVRARVQAADGPGRRRRVGGGPRAARRIDPAGDARTGVGAPAGRRADGRRPGRGHGVPGSAGHRVADGLLRVRRVRARRRSSSVPSCPESPLWESQRDDRLSPMQALALLVRRRLVGWRRLLVQAGFRCSPASEARSAWDWLTAQLGSSRRRRPPATRPAAPSGHPPPWPPRATARRPCRAWPAGFRAATPGIPRSAVRNRARTDGGSVCVEALMPSASRQSTQATVPGGCSRCAASISTTRSGRKRRRGPVKFSGAVLPSMSSTSGAPTRRSASALTTRIPAPSSPLMVLPTPTMATRAGRGSGKSTGPGLPGI